MILTFEAEEIRVCGNQVSVDGIDFNDLYNKVAKVKRDCQEEIFRRHIQDTIRILELNQDQRNIDRFVSNLLLGVERLDDVVDFLREDKRNLAAEEKNDEAT